MEDYKPHIGKNVIETLTLGMYENSLFIYREYVQNATDQIDVAVEEGILNTKSDGKINIYIDKENRSISIKDNATGIKSSEVLQFLGDVANSQKDRTKRKGFGGIGRLGGLAYCEKLIFETSYNGENIKSIITLNAKQLKRIINDETITLDVATVISVITSLDKKEEKINDHYFNVKLIDVTNEDLLNVNEVREYLSMIAPVPYHNSFFYKKKIYQKALELGYLINELNINLNKKQIFKKYTTSIYEGNANSKKRIDEIIDIDFFELKNSRNQLYAWGWYSISGLLQMIPQINTAIGLRLRMENIQIGDEKVFRDLFKETRFAFYYFGEVFTINKNLIINAQKSYFIKNKALSEFEILLKSLFEKLRKLIYTSSHIRANERKLKDVSEEKVQEIKKAKKLSKKEIQLIEKIELIIDNVLLPDLAKDLKSEIKNELNNQE